MSFNVGDKVVYDNSEGIILAKYNEHHLVFFPRWQQIKRGHHAWKKYEEGIKNLNSFGIKYDKESLFGSWWCQTHELKLSESFLVVYKNNPYWKVCNKIKQMDDKRKELGYAF